MNTRTLWLGGGLCLLLAVTAAAGPRDGAGQAGILELALHGQALVARLTLPSSQVVGFDRAPANDEEKKAVSDALARLGQARYVVEPLAEARCSVTREQAESALTGEQPTPPTHFTGRYAWHCENPQALLAVDIPLLEYINGMPLETLVMGADGERWETVRAPRTRIPMGDQDPGA